MTIHVETPLVRLFGNSVFFGDKLDMLPMIFQPIMFYPDWFFMTWPVQLFFAITGNGNHPYLHSVGPGAIGWSLVWYVAGAICGILGASRTFTEIVSADMPLLIRIPYKFFAYLLFWHIVIARMISSLITRLTTWSANLTYIIDRTVYILMLLPPIVGLLVSALALTGFFSHIV